MTAAVFLHMPAHEYHSAERISNSMLSDLAKSPRHFWARHLWPERPRAEPTPAMLAGTLAHCVALEPNEVHKRYAVKPAGLDGRTSAGKSWLANADGKEIVSAEQYETACYQAQAVADVPELLALLSSGDSEVSFFWEDAATGIPCKGRADRVHTLSDGRVILMDLKTTPDVSPAEFARSVWKYGYHRQAAWYSRGYAAAAGVEVAAFVFAAVTNAYPFIAVPYLLDDDAMRRGGSECNRLLELYAECKESDEWPAYGDGVQVISLPSWSKE